MVCCLQVTVAWNPESFYLMMGEQSRISDPAVRLANRRLMQAAFSKEALVGYVDKVRKRLVQGLWFRVGIGLRVFG